MQADYLEAFNHGAHSGSTSRAGGGLVNRVAAKLVELGREEIARGRALARAGAFLAVECDLLERVGALVLKPDIAVKPGAQPAREQRRLGDGASHTQIPSLCDPGPEAREDAPPGLGAPPGDVRAAGPLEGNLRVGLRDVGPLAGVDDEAVADVRSEEHTSE